MKQDGMIKGIADLFMLIVVGSFVLFFTGLTLLIYKLTDLYDECAVVRNVANVIAVGLFLLPIASFLGLVAYGLISGHDMSVYDDWNSVNVMYFEPVCLPPLYSWTLLCTWPVAAVSVLIMLRSYHGKRTT